MPAPEYSSEQSPAEIKLEKMLNELTLVQKKHQGFNAIWDNSAENLWSLLDSARQTVRDHQELPEGINLKLLTEKFIKIMGTRP